MTSCHDCIAELVNRHTALAGMMRRGHWDRAKDEVRALGKTIDAMALRCLRSGETKYKGREDARPEKTD